MALGHGIHIIQRKKQNIIVMDNGEFCIPDQYSDEARDQFITMLWGGQVNFDALQQQINQQRIVWQTTKKKDKNHMFYSFIAKLPYSLEVKKIYSDLIMIAFFLKMIRKQDLIYTNAKIEFIHPRLFNLESYLVVESSRSDSICDNNSEDDMED